MLPLDGYIRVSQVGAREGEGFISPEVQERAIRDWAERQALEVVIQRPELNVSGGTMDRPVFNSIMERVRRGQSGGIVVYKTDRFARTLLGALSTLAELGEHNAAFASATEPELDYSTPAGRAFLQMMFVFAEFVRSSLKESWHTSQRMAIERGIHISPNGYLGYELGPDRRLVPNAQAPLAVEMFRRRGRGEAWGMIARWLNQRAPKPDGTDWTAQAVQRLCSKRIYRGEASRYVEQDVDNRGPIVNRRAHPALITEDEWQLAQMDPAAARGGAHDGPLPLLSGLIRCAGCRFVMSKSNGPKGERMYRCRGRHASGRCPETASIMADEIEAHVEGAVLSEIDGIARFVPDSRARDRAVRALARSRAEYDDFRRDRAARRKLGPDWHDSLDVYREAVSEAEAELRRIDARIGAVMKGLTREHYLALPIDERREVLAGFVDCVFIRRSRGRGRNVDPVATRSRILWIGQAPADLPRRRVVNPITSFHFEEDVKAGVAAP